MRPPRPDRFDVVVVGSFFTDWLTVLAPDSDIWTQLPEVASVRMEPSGWSGGPGAETRLVLPLLEHNIRACPAGWSLIPGETALATLDDKARFARFIDDNGLGSHAPGIYAGIDSAIYPCVLKRTDLFASHGVRVVFSREELEESLTEELWAGKPYLLQEYIEAAVDYTVNGVAVNGMMLTHFTYVFDPPPESLIRIPMADEVVTRAQLGARNIFAVQQILARTGFSGPYNVSSRLRPNGAIAVIEINPRLGGSMFRPATRGHLVELLRAIIGNATWHEPAT